MPATAWEPIKAKNLSVQPLDYGVVWPSWNRTYTTATTTSSTNRGIWQDSWAPTVVTSSAVPPGQIYVMSSSNATTSGNSSVVWGQWTELHTARTEWIRHQESAWRQWQDTYQVTYTVSPLPSLLTPDEARRRMLGDNEGGYQAEHEGRPLRRALRDRLGGELVRSEEEWAAVRAENERLRADRDVLQVAARGRARELLAIVLTRAQMTQYETQGHFDVLGSEGGLFRIHHGTSGNIRQLVDGREVNRLCVHPELYDREGGGGHLPTEDCLAAQALALMHDELGAVTRANVHEGVRHLRAA